MPSATTLLREATRNLDRTFALKGGLYRFHYGWRNPDVGRGLGLSGVENEELIHCYAAAMEKAREVLVGWGWPEPRRAAGGYVPVWVFRTERLGYGDHPLTLPFEYHPRQY